MTLHRVGTTLELPKFQRFGNLLQVCRRFELTAPDRAKKKSPGGDRGKGNGVMLCL